MRACSKAYCIATWVCASTPCERWAFYLRFSRLLLNSLIMSDRNTLRTSILSGDWGEFFRRAAITFRISGREKTDKNKVLILFITSEKENVTNQKKIQEIFLLLAISN